MASPSNKTSADDGDTRSGRRRRRKCLIVIASILPEVGVLRRRGYGFGGNVIVRCREGHVFSTIWIPGASVKSLRLGPWRFQRCPVGQHWSFVTPVSEADLTEQERLSAAENRDSRVP